MGNLWGMAAWRGSCCSWMSLFSKERWLYLPWFSVPGWNSPWAHWSCELDERASANKAWVFYEGEARTLQIHSNSVRIYRFFFLIPQWHYQPINMIKSLMVLLLFIIIYHSNFYWVAWSQNRWKVFSPPSISRMTADWICSSLQIPLLLFVSVEPSISKPQQCFAALRWKNGAQEWFCTAL